jgi:hypothetical protein
VAYKNPTTRFGIRLASLPSSIRAAYTGKREVGTFVQKYMPASQVNSRNYRREGGRVKWEFTVTWELTGADASEGLRQMGITQVEGSAVADFEGSRVKALTVTLTPASQSAVQKASG